MLITTFRIVRKTINLLIILNLIGILIISTVSIRGYIPNANSEHSKLYSRGEFLYYGIERDEKELNSIIDRAKNGEDVIDEISNKTSKIIADKEQFNQIDKRLGDINNYQTWLYTSSLILIILFINLIFLIFYKKSYNKSIKNGG